MKTKLSPSRQAREMRIAFAVLAVSLAVTAAALLHVGPPLKPRVGEVIRLQRPMAAPARRKPAAAPQASAPQQAPTHTATVHALDAKQHFVYTFQGTAR